jgi:PmbA protein
MDFAVFKEEVIARCKSQGIEEYELYYQSVQSTSVSIHEHEVNQFTGSVEGGVCFRCIVNGKMGYASTEELSETEARTLVSRAVDNALFLETEDKVFLGKGGQTYEEISRKQYDLPSTEALIEGALKAQQALYDGDPAVVDGTTTEALSEESHLAICNSNGLDLNYVNRVAGLITVAVVQKDGEMSNEFRFRLGALDTIDHQALAKETVQEALKKLGGEPAATGVYPVVFSPEAMADLLRTFCDIFSSETAQKGLSKLAEAEGTQIAAPCVTIMDDPFHPENPFPMPFDAEGTPARKKAVVEKGELRTLLYNLKTAYKAGKNTTGNASKAGYQASLGVRPFTMYLEGGSLSEAQLLEMAEEGVYIDSLQGLHAGANGVSGDFSLQSAGYLIQKGQKTHRVKSFTVAGNFYELLKNITAVADNTCLHNALGRTAFGAPSTLVQGLSIAGK